MIKLREYQQEARDSVLQEWEGGNLETVLAMATGTGKTETFLGTLAAENEAGRLERALIVAHRKELIEQPINRIADHWADQLPGTGIVMGGQRDHGAPLVVATVQTLANESRLEAVCEAGLISHVIIDEAHHAVSPTYMTLIERLKEKNPSLRILGVTATPRRADGDGLKKVFKSVAYRISIKDAIVRLKCLVPFTAIAVELPVSFEGVKEVGEGWESEAAGQILSAENALEIIVETWKKHASERKTMAFTASVFQARMMAEAFRAAGIAAEWASGNTKKDEREAIVERYKSGETQVLVNCALWTEGFDVPETGCVIMARPTKSDSVYVQAAGRGLRLAPGKADCLILDFAPIGARDIRLAGDLLGKPRAQRKAEESAKDKGVILECFAMNSEGSGIDADPDEVQMRVLDFFGGSRLAWTFDGGIASVSIGDKQSLAIILPENHRIARAEKLKQSGIWSELHEQLFHEVSNFRVCLVKRNGCDLLGVEGDWEGAAMIAQDYADEWGIDTLSGRKNKWRKAPASAGQLDFLKRLGLPHEGVSKGEAAQAITHKLALSTLQKEGVIRVPAN